MKFEPAGFSAACMNSSGPSGVSVGGKFASGVPPYSVVSAASAPENRAL